jgi:hypothetical protein
LEKRERMRERMNGDYSIFIDEEDYNMRIDST